MTRTTKVKPEQAKKLLYERRVAAAETLKLVEAEKPKKIEPFEIGIKSEPIRLEYLTEGRRFEVIGCEKVFKNLFVKRISPCSILVGGEKTEGKEEPWVNLGANHYMAPGTIVRGL